MDEGREKEQKESELEVKKLEEEVDLFELVGVVWRRKALIASLFLPAVILTFIISSLLTPVYRAKVTLIPMEEKQASILAKIPPAATALAALGMSGMTSSESTIIALLKSRTLTERVISRLGLMDILCKKCRKMEDPPTIHEIAKNFAEENIKVKTNAKMRIITLQVDFPGEATLVPLVANVYTDELEKLLRENTYTLAKHHRISVEESLRKARKELKSAENAFNRFQKRYNVISVDKQTEESVKIYAELAVELAKREIELDVMRKLMGETSPVVIKLKYEIDELRKKLEEFGGKVPKGYIMQEDKRILIPLAEVPDIALRYLRVRREFEMKNEIFKMLKIMHEKAKIEEAKEDIFFQVVDKAVVPRKPAKPKKLLNMAVAGTLAIFLGIFLSFILEGRKRSLRR